MAIFIAVVTNDGKSGYSASFPDYPTCAVAARTIDEVIAKAKYALLTQVEGLLAANQRICAATPADSLERNGTLLLAAIDVPDDIRQVRVELDLPALSLARIDAFAEQLGLTRSALFVDAVDRWAIQEAVPRSGAGEDDRMILPDFDNPFELKVATIAVAEERQHPPAVDPGKITEQGALEVTADITAELARLLEAQATAHLSNAATDNLDPHQSPIGRRR
jgi:predicted RNase H-like HicB family nuclease